MLDLPVAGGLWLVWRGSLAFGLVVDMCWRLPCWFGFRWLMIGFGLCAGFVGLVGVFYFWFGGCFRPVRVLWVWLI